MAIVLLAVVIFQKGMLPDVLGIWRHVKGGEKKEEGSRGRRRRRRPKYIGVMLGPWSRSGEMNNLFIASIPDKNCAGGGGGGGSVCQCTGNARMREERTASCSASSLVVSGCITPTRARRDSVPICLGIDQNLGVHSQSMGASALLGPTVNDMLSTQLIKPPHRPGLSLPEWDAAKRAIAKDPASAKLWKPSLKSAIESIMNPEIISLRGASCAVSASMTNPCCLKSSSLSAACKEPRLSPRVEKIRG